MKKMLCFVLLFVLGLSFYRIVSGMEELSFYSFVNSLEYPFENNIYEFLYTYGLTANLPNVEIPLLREFISLFYSIIDMLLFTAYSFVELLKFITHFVVVWFAPPVS